MIIGDLIGRKPLKGCLFGVEVEVEGAGLPRNVPGFSVVREGSLRPVEGEDGREYVFSRPVGYDQSMGNLQVLKNLLDVSPIVQFSNRTSIHVHVNVTDLTVSEWFTFLFLWVVYEDAFINFCGNERKGNLFCLSSRDAEGLMFALEEFAFNGVIHNLNDEVRYSAVNTAATNKYGSVEFRSMRGTMDLGILGAWLDALRRIRTKAQELKSPKALIEALLVDPEQFTYHLFPEGHFIHDFPNLNRYIAENTFRCALIVDHCNFDKFDFSDEPNHDI
jgi:hypothetical protein